MAITEKPRASVTEGITGPITSRAWWHRHLDPEERRRVMTELAMTRTEHWVWRFTVMLTLSVVVAVMGLSADSAAVVIGAMLLAPLMQPVLATAASLSMSLMRKSALSLLKVALATAWCILIAYVLSSFIPDGSLPGEVEARTRPDIRDLVVALAAGAAGAYATVRKDASSALPGVAVAVALVPPLAAIGITLEAGERDLAIGATLLYTTNLAAIVFAGVMVFIATGFVPPRRLANTALQLLVAAVIALTLVVIIAVPLFRTSVAAVEAAEDELAARSIVDAWLGDLDLNPQVDVDDERIFVQLRGFERPPAEEELRASLLRRFGDDVSVNVQWTRTERATTTTTVVVAPSEEEVLLARIGPVVDRWLVDSDVGSGYELDEIDLGEDGVVIIDVTGSGQPPSVDELIDRLRTEADVERSVSLNWTARETITPGVTIDPIETLEQELEPIIAAWAEASEVDVISYGYDGERVRVEVLGATEPRIEPLLADLEAVDFGVDGRETPVEVYFTQQRLVTTTEFVVDFFGDTVLVPSGPTTTTTTTQPGGPPPTTAGN